MPTCFLDFHRVCRAVYASLFIGGKSFPPGSLNSNYLSFTLRPFRVHTRFSASFHSKVLGFSSHNVAHMDSLVLYLSTVRILSTSNDVTARKIQLNHHELELQIMNGRRLHWMKSHSNTVSEYLIWYQREF